MDRRGTGGAHGILHFLGNPHSAGGPRSVYASPQESERLLRISGVFERAVELFEGDIAAAVTWLTTPQKSLGRHSPLIYARTEVGAREVENLIGRLEHGVFT
jgi:putative toxin-antitoxin system antitoxin component (TIGR02293 family)